MPIMDVAAPPDPVATDSEVVRIERTIREAIDQLPTSWADALRLRIDGELSYDDISKVLKCTKAQVRTWIYRARRQLERDLAHEDFLIDTLQAER